MGTNYYTKTKKCVTCGHQPDGIHLGKSSFGWRFVFQFNGGKFYKDVDEMTVWLRDKKIVDEYGKNISHDDFWEMVQYKQGEKNKGGIYLMDIGGYDFSDHEFS